jgi:predicted RecB family nuclease
VPWCCLDWDTLQDIGITTIETLAQRSRFLLPKMMEIVYW